MVSSETEEASHLKVADFQDQEYHLPSRGDSIFPLFISVGGSPGFVLSVPSRVSPRDCPRSSAVTTSLLEVSSVGRGGVFTTMFLCLFSSVSSSSKSGFQLS